MKPERERQGVEGLAAFEKRLMQVPLRRAPDGIQAAVLAGALEPRARRSEDETGGEAGRMSSGWLRELIWPSPKAWGCLAVGWAIIAVAQLSLPASVIPKASVLARSSWSHPVDRESLQWVREQRELLARLISPPAPPPATRGPVPGPQILYWNARQRGNWENLA